LRKSYIIGYGTLLYSESLGHTIGSSVNKKKFIPVIVKGYKRIFNLLPDHYKPSFRMSTLPIELAAANVIPSEGAFFNGLAFMVSDAELAELDKREKSYQRKEADIYDFFREKYMGKAFLYSAGYGFKGVTKDSRYLPEWEDLAFARTGAYRYGDKFGEMYDNTTFLVDGVTLASAYYKDYLSKLILDK